MTTGGCGGGGGGGTCTGAGRGGRRTEDRGDSSGAVLGGLTVEVPQTQFIDSECSLVANRDEIPQVQLLDRLFFGCGCTGASAEASEIISCIFYVLALWSR